MLFVAINLALLLLIHGASGSGDVHGQLSQDFDISAVSSDAVQGDAQGAAALKGGFGVAAESGSFVQGAGSDGLIDIPGLPVPVASSELEVEVQRTSKVAAFLAQDAAELAKNLATLQSSLRGKSLEALPDKDRTRLTSLLSLGAVLPQHQKLGGDDPANASDNITATSNQTSIPNNASGTSAKTNCVIVDCEFIKDVVTFDGRYPFSWGIINFVLIVIVGVLTFWLCCAFVGSVA
eukprot:TRINITY_DN33050_c0_g1_i1.p1 TRINITY_DN33050_c0_g1~~TRINITY_DN33050_c0_g1_i1.p1  ORF type:complete len:270 (-),score=42.42 TRINITY_DN33050_c0_g1_i1:302-1009(-)